ncbi:MAG: DUF1634 domain-containing protein [Dehalococcoidales bacterium]|jgi:uncharacterized membrane protein|nr:DUF1634 domain-containing protein [Dehalococcoidales bacterium]
MSKPGSQISRLDSVISYILIIGLVASLILIITGLILYCLQGNLEIQLEKPEVYIQGNNFFTFLGGLLSGSFQTNTAIFFMTLGIAVLILTPFIRVLASVFYFVVIRDAKYIAITLFVLIVLTISLALH